MVLVCCLNFQYMPIHAQQINEYVELSDGIQIDNRIEEMVEEIHDLIMQGNSIDDIIKIIVNEQVDCCDRDKLRDHLQMTLHKEDKKNIIMQIIINNNKIEQYYDQNHSKAKDDFKFFLNPQMLLLTLQIITLLYIIWLLASFMLKWMPGEQGFFKGALKKTLPPDDNNDYTKKSDFHVPDDNDNTPKPLIAQNMVQESKTNQGTPLEDLQIIESQNILVPGGLEDDVVCNNQSGIMLNIISRPVSCINEDLLQQVEALSCQSV
ncbi:MAG: hypothetical protein US69_C0006G0002 [candidate division TM6 bacterium GW2011_GWF2_38_10]|nr:MAG: hypothetical protein US69_C0006G0002 [candidate division TM6 bacterium GW2011_GWF2_38_10]